MGDSLAYLFLIKQILIIYNEISSTHQMQEFIGIFVSNKKQTSIICNEIS